MGKWKKPIIFALAMVIILYAALLSPTLAADMKYVGITVNGRYIDFDSRPFIDGNSRTIIPIKFIAVEMGYKVDWDAQKKVAVLENTDTKIVLTIDSEVAQVNGKETTLDTNAAIIDGRTMVPLRFIMEAFGAKVTFNTDRQRVDIAIEPANGNVLVAEKRASKIEIDIAGTLNVRSEPSSDTGTVIAKANDGETYYVLDATEKWYRIDYPGVNSAWVFKDYGKPLSYETFMVEKASGSGTGTGNGDSDNVPYTEVKKVKVIISSTSSLNIRSSASLTGEIIGKAVRGDTFKYLAAQGDWYKVEYGNTTGWIYSDYAEIIVEKILDYDSIQSGQCKVNSPVVNIRSTPEALADNSNKIGQVSIGTVLKILGGSGDWYKVRTPDGTEGWIIKRAVDLLDENGNLITNNGLEIKYKDRVMITNQDNVNIRTGPGISYSIITQANKGDVYEITNMSGDWYEIALANGQKGYIIANLVSIRSEQPFDKQIDDKDRNINATLKQISYSSTNGIIVNSDSSLVYKVFYLNDPARILVQFYDVTLAKTVAKEIAVNKNGIKNIQISQFNKDRVRMILNLDKPSSLVVKENGNLGQKQLAYSITAAPLAGKKIVIDPGHGAYKNTGSFDPGAVSSNGTYEYKLTTDIAMETADLLIANGAEVVMTRREGESLTLDLDTRVSIANASDADIFVSIHNDSFPTNPSASGMSVYYYASGDVSGKAELADGVLSELVAATQRPGRGVKTANYYVIKNTNMTSILVEVGFLSNPEEEALLKTAAFRHMAAEGIVEGIVKFCK